MSSTSNDDRSTDTNEQIADLAARVESADQVRGGFNPQPEPPTSGNVPPQIGRPKLTPAWPVKW